MLLKNERELLPLAQAPKYVVLAGERIMNSSDEGITELYLDYDNIGAQNGGWSVRWQGYMGNRFWKDDLKAKSGAMSILDSLKLTYPNATFLYANYTNTTNMTQVSLDRSVFLKRLANLTSDMNANNTVIIQVAAEVPYAEFGGDINCKYC